MTTPSRLAALVTRLRASQLVRNVFANYFATIWMAALSLLTIPIYVRLLGSEEWGIVAACMTVQGLLGLLDVGLGQIMPRSFARIAGDEREEATLFDAYSRIYLALGSAGLVLGQLAASPLARSWFHASGDHAPRLELAIRLVLVQFLFQIANNAHTGYWNGMQLQVEGNLRTCAFVTLRQLAALLAVRFVDPSAAGYILPFAAGTALEWYLNRRSIARRYRALARPPLPFASPKFRAILRDAGGFTVAILVGLVATQSDRVILSATQDLTQYGYYVIVANLGLAFTSLQAPLTRALFPRIVMEVADRPGASGSASATLLRGVLLFGVIPCLVVIASAPWVLSTWLHAPEIVAAATPALRLILAGVAVNALYGVVYQRMLAAGDSRAVLAINAALVLAVAVTVALAGTRIGIVLGGIIWLAIASTQLVLGIAWQAYRKQRA